MARRFSGRLFGGEKKKDASKKPDPTQEEIQAAAQAADPAEVSIFPSPTSARDCYSPRYSFLVRLLLFLMPRPKSPRIQPLR